MINYDYYDNTTIFIFWLLASCFEIPTTVGGQYTGQTPPQKLNMEN